MPIRRIVYKNRLVLIDHFATQHISQSQDVQVRVKWDDRTVSLWDNRVTAHTAISDYDVRQEAEGLRHGFRITTLGESPVGVDGLKSEW